MIPRPTTHDGRNLDVRIADEHGEGATIAVDRPEVAWPLATEPAQQVTDTYYDLPVIKAAPWKWYVPAYFYLGGLGGAAATMIPTLRGREARRLHWIASIAEGSGALCLIADLGKPLKFVNMMRVFRPTSPMNMGTWILSAASGAGGLGLLVDSKVLASIAGVAGSMLSTYTGVLLGNTTVPVWHATRRRLPLWFAASSAADTDFMAMLLDIHPTGFAQRLCDGMVRARFRDGMDRPSPIEPGQIYRYEIDCWCISQMFRKGHRIALQITSSAFPKYERNLNTGESLATGTRMLVAEQQIYHDAAHRSCVILPIVPREH